MANLEAGISSKGATQGSREFKKAVDNMIMSVNKLDKSMKGLKKGMNQGKKATDEVAKAAKKSKKDIAALDSATRKLSGAWGLLTKSVFNFKNAYITVIALFTARAMFNFTKEVFMVGAAFEKTMVTVKLVSRATNEQYKEMTKQARMYGAVTEHTATQVADAMRFLAMAGLNVKEVMESVATTLNFATAANLSMGAAADISTNVMTSMGIASKNLEMVHDVLVTTIQSSNSTVEELAESFRYAAGTANLMGIDIQFLSAMLGKLHDSGVKGSIAGTNLNQAFIKIAQNLPEFVDGGEGILKLLTEMNEKQWGVTKSISAFGVRGARAMMLLANSSDDAVKKLVKLHKTVKDGTGTNKDFAEAMRETAWGSLRVFQSAIEDIKLEVFANKTGAMTESLNKMTDFMRDNKDEITDFAEKIVNGVTDATPLLLKLAKDMAFWAGGAIKLLSGITNAVNDALEAEAAIKALFKGDEATVEEFKFEKEVKRLEKLRSNWKQESGGAKFYLPEVAVPLGLAKINDELVKLYENVSNNTLEAKIKKITSAIDNLKKGGSGTTELNLSREMFALEDQLAKMKSLRSDPGVGIDKDGKAINDTNDKTKVLIATFDDLNNELNTTFKDRLPGVTKAMDIYAKATRDAEKTSQDIIDSFAGFEFPEGDIEKFKAATKNIFKNMASKHIVAKSTKQIERFVNALDATALSARKLKLSKNKTFFDNFRDIADLMPIGEIKDKFNALIDAREKLGNKKITSAFDLKDADKITKIMEKAERLSKDSTIGMTKRQKEIHKVQEEYKKLSDELKIAGKDSADLEDKLKEIEETKIAKILDIEIKFDTKELEKAIKEFSDKAGDILSGTITSAIEDGFEGALLYIQNVFMDTFKNELSDVISTSFKGMMTQKSVGAGTEAIKGVAGSATGSIGGGSSAGALGGISAAGGIWGAIGAAAIGSYVGVRKKNKAQRKEEEALMQSIKDLTKSIISNTTELSRALDINFEATRWSEKLYKIQMENTKFISENKAPERRTERSREAYDLWVNMMGEQRKYVKVQTDVVYSEILDAHQDFLEKYLEQEKSTRQETFESLFDDASELSTGFVEAFGASSVVAALDAEGASFTDALADLLSPEELDEVINNVKAANPNALIDLVSTLFDGMSKEEIEIEYPGFLTSLDEGQAIYYFDGLEDVVRNVTDVLSNDTIPSWEKLDIIMKSGLLTNEQMTEALGIQVSAWEGIIETTKRFEAEHKKILGDVDFFMEDIRGNVSPLEHALKGVNSQFDTWEDAIYDVTEVENALSTERQDAVDITTALYDSEGNLLEKAEDLVKALNELGVAMDKLYKDTFQPLFEDLEFLQSGQTRQGWVEDQIEDLMAIPGALTEEQFSKLMGYTSEWYGLVTKATKEQEDLAKIWEDVTKKVENLVDSIESTIRSIKYGGLNVSTTAQKLEQATPDYQKLLAAAQTGDEGAIQEFLGFSSQYLQIAQDTYKSSEDYQKIYESVMEDLDDLNKFVQSTDYSQKIFDEAQKTNTTLNAIQTLSATELGAIRDRLYTISAAALDKDITIDGIVSVKIVGGLEFDKDIYLKNKQSTILENQGILKPIEEIMNNIEDTFSGSDTPYKDHFKDYGIDEGVSPYDLSAKDTNLDSLNSGLAFNKDVYLENKQATILANSGILKPIEEIMKNIENTFSGSATPYRDHFKNFGIAEGVTPYANGGIADRPTYGVFGEAGPEAFVPLQNGAIPVRMEGGGQVLNITVEVAGEEFYAEVDKRSDNVRVKANKRPKNEQRRMYQ